jgi:hypothetical protein
MSGGAARRLVTPRRPAARIFDQIVPGGGFAGECVAGASWLPDDAWLVYKVLGMETEPVKAMVREFWNWSGEKSPARRYRRHGHGDHRWRRRHRSRANAR